MGRLESDPSRIAGLFRHQIRQGCRIELETVQARNQQESKESARRYDLIFLEDVQATGFEQVPSATPSQQASKPTTIGIQSAGSKQIIRALQLHDTLMTQAS